MISKMDQRPYWNAVADAKSFTHPLPLHWLDRIAITERILDFGCGYGRIGRELISLGYSSVVGVDFSSAMIARAQNEVPQLRFEVVDSLPTAFDDGVFDVTFLFAVLTCIPSSADQDEIMAELWRVLRPGGLLLLSDLPLQTGPREVERYQRDAERFGAFGLFETTEGAVVRHHNDRRWGELLKGFHQQDRREVEVATMNGSPCRVIQILAEKPSF